MTVLFLKHLKVDLFNVLNERDKDFYPITGVIPDVYSDSKIDVYGNEAPVVFTLLKTPF